MHPIRPPGTRSFADVNHDGLADLFIVVKGNIGAMPDFATLDPNNLLLQADGRFIEAGHLAGIASVRRTAACSST